MRTIERQVNHIVAGREFRDVHIHRESRLQIGRLSIMRSHVTPLGSVSHRLLPSRNSISRLKPELYVVGHRLRQFVDDPTLDADSLRPGDSILQLLFCSIPVFRRASVTCIERGFFATGAGPATGLGVGVDSVRLVSAALSVQAVVKAIRTSEIATFLPALLRMNLS